MATSHKKPPHFSQRRLKIRKRRIKRAEELLKARYGAQIKRIPAFRVSEGVKEVKRKVAKLCSEKEVVVVLVCGPQGSGKTKLTSRLAKDLNAGLIHTDAYYKPFEVVDGLTLYFDDPRAVDYEQMVRDIKNWKLGKDIEMPVHDPVSHKQAGTKKIPHRKVLFVEGIMAFHPELIKLADLRVYVEASPSKRLKRRLRRDVRERGRTVQYVKDRFYSTIERARLRFLERWKPKADLIIIT